MKDVRKKIISILPFLLVAIFYNSPAVYAQSFSSPVSYSASQYPADVATGDVDGINGVDLVVADYYSNTVSVFLNNGNGSYATAVSYIAGTAPVSVTTADVDGVNGLDIVASNYNSNGISVFLNNGDGTFITQAFYSVGEVQYTAGRRPVSVIAADLDGENGPDIAVANAVSDDISVLFNNGDGTYSMATQYAVGERPFSILAIDVDNENGLDLVTANTDSRSVSVLLNNGDGSYTTLINYPVIGTPKALSSADFDLKNGLDIAISTSHRAVILLNNGDGSYASPVYYSAGDTSTDIVAGDFDAVNGPDMAVSNFRSNDVSVFLNNGDGTFGIQKRYEGVTNPHSIATADVDGVSGLDLITSDVGSDAISILLNKGNEFGPSSFYDQVDVELDEWISSNVVVVENVNQLTQVSIDGGEYRVNNEPFTSAVGTVNNGDALVVRVKSSLDYYTTVEGHLYVGNIVDTFSTITIRDTVPEPFSFVDEVDSPLNTEINSNTITISGLGEGVGVPLSITGDCDFLVRSSSSSASYLYPCEYLNGAEVFVRNGSTVIIRQISSVEYSTAINIVLTIGGVSDTFSVTTLTESVPDDFSFTDQIGVALNTLTASNALTLRGLRAPVMISVSGGEYRINGGAYTDLTGTVNNSDTVNVRQISSAEYNTTTNTVLTIGGVSDTFSVTTLTSTATSPQNNTIVSDPSVGGGLIGIWVLTVLFLLSTRRLSTLR